MLGHQLSDLLFDLDPVVRGGPERLYQRHKESLPGGGAMGGQTADKTAEDVRPRGIVCEALGRLEKEFIYHVTRFY